MDSTTHWNSSDIAVQTVDASERCAICTHRASGVMLAMQERCAQEVTPNEPQTWLLCADCAAAVTAELERAALRTPLRLRIALGIVATQRRPQRRPADDDADDSTLNPDGDPDPVVIGLVVFLFALALVIALVEVIFAYPGLIPG